MKSKIKGLLLCAITTFSFVLVSNQAECKEVKTNPSYYTVKTENDLQHAINISNKGDSIVITGNISLSRKLDIPSDKDLTISNDGQSRMIQRGNDYKGEMIVIGKGATLTLRSIGGTDENPTLIIDGNGDKVNSDSNGRIISNSGVFNMNTGTALQNNRISHQAHGVRGCAILNSSNSVFNMNGGKISQNMFISSDIGGIIFMDENSKLNMSGGIISNNNSTFYEYVGHYKTVQSRVIYCKDKNIVNLSGGKILNNSCDGIYANYTQISMINGSISENDGRGIYMKGGTIKISGGSISKNKQDGICCDNGNVEMTGGSIYENGGKGIYCNGKVIMSGGLIENNSGIGISGEFRLSGTARIVSNNINLAKDKKIIIDGPLIGNEDLIMNVSLSEYKLFNTQKIIETDNNVNLHDVVGRFKLANDAYGINSKGYVDDTQFQDFEKTDTNTGIKITALKNTIINNSKCEILKMNPGANVTNATFYMETFFNGIKQLYAVKFSANGQEYIPSEIDKITIYFPIENLYSKDIPEFKVFDSKKNEITGNSNLSSVDGKLYAKITPSKKV